MTPPHSPPTAAEPITARIHIEDDRDPARSPQPVDLTLHAVRSGPTVDGAVSMTFVTDAGEFAGRFHPVETPPGATDRAVVWVGGAGGGLDGPARGLYPAACAALQRAGVAGLRIHYRRPNDLPACILDTLLAIEFLHRDGVERVALVGHSFGGAVVISAGALSGSVTAVVALSTQTYGADLAAQVSPRPLLLVHGTEDEILPHVCSELVHAAAREPKELKLLPGASHGLDSAREELLELLVNWLDRNT